jgi:hypothetical protein
MGNNTNVVLIINRGVIKLRLGGENMKVILAENEQDFLVGLVEVLQDLGMDVITRETDEGIILSS